MTSRRSYKKVNIVISDEIVALQEAKKLGNATIAVIGEKKIPIELSGYAVLSFDDVDDEYLRLVASRHIGEPFVLGSTKRLKIREIFDADIDFLNKNTDLKFGSSEDIKEYIRAMYDFNGFGIYILELGTEKIGIAGFYIEENNILISYEILKEYQREGYATEAIVFLKKYMEWLGNKFYAKIDDENEASLCLMRKLGLTRLKQ